MEKERLAAEEPSEFVTYLSQLLPNKGPSAWCHSSQQNKQSPVQKQRKGLFFGQRMERLELAF